MAKENTVYRVPDGVKIIKDFTFYDCFYLEKIILPISIEEIERNAIYDDMDIYYMGTSEEWQHVREYLYNTIVYNYKEYAYELISNSEIAISQYYGIEEEVSLPQKIDGYSVTGIKSNAFASTQDVKVINIPSTITNIEANAFNQAKKIQSVNVDKNNSLYISYDGVLYDKKENILVYYPYGKKESVYRIADGTVKLYTCSIVNDFIQTLIIPKSVNQIELGAVKCSGLKNIYYTGSESDWEKIEIVQEQNEILFNANTTFDYKIFIPGDINGDGIVNTKDISTLRRYNSKGYNVEVVEEALDVNRDGIINTKDITTLRRYNSSGYGIELK